MTPSVELAIQAFFYLTNLYTLLTYFIKELFLTLVRRSTRRWSFTTVTSPVGLHPGQWHSPSYETSRSKPSYMKTTRVTNSQEPSYKQSFNVCTTQKTFLRASDNLTDSGIIRECHVLGLKEKSVVVGGCYS